MYTPSWAVRPLSRTHSSASVRSAGVYIRVTSKKRGPNCSMFAPRSGLAPASLMWSETTMMSPGR